MKQKDIALLIGVGFFTAIISFVISGLLFGGSQKKTSVPTAEPISTSFPDVRHDPGLHAIFYDGAVDPAQPVPVGNNQNPQPFNGSD